MSNNNNNNNNAYTAGRRVCIIGAGTAGLCALKNSLEHGMSATCYEQSNAIGGTWIYSEQNLEHIKNEEDVHSSMYEGLRTNLPKEIMGYPDYLYPEQPESFVSAMEVLKFLESYAQHFALQPHIKLQHSVIRVRPSNGQWEIYVRNNKDGAYSVTHYDYVFVCNGHYTTPLYPEIEGMDVYGGKQMHSHLYRKAAVFKDATVLVIGAGPSGMDISHHISKYAKHVFLSHHLNPAPVTHFMQRVTQKPDLRRFHATGALFEDGSSEDFDCVIYCTGYKYTFPFLSVDCGLRVDENFVQPLYKHCINIRYPSMALIGLPINVCPTQLFDLQVRFALKYFSGQKQLPSHAEMEADFERDIQQRWASGLSKREAHKMGEQQFAYYKELSELAGITNIKPVIEKMMRACGRKYIYELDTYRDSCFKVLDDENFVKYPLSQS